MIKEIDNELIEEFKERMIPQLDLYILDLYMFSDQISVLNMVLTKKEALILRDMIYNYSYRELNNE